MADEEIIYPRLVLKVVSSDVEGDDEPVKIVVEAVEIGFNDDEDLVEMTCDQGQLYELSANDLGDIIEEAKDHAAKLGIPYYNEISNEDEPEVTDDDD